MKHFISQAAIARELGVTRAAVSNWLIRWPGSVPAPDALLDDRPIWFAHRIDAWREWVAVSSRYAHLREDRPT